MFGGGGLPKPNLGPSVAAPSGRGAPAPAPAPAPSSASAPASASARATGTKKNGALAAAAAAWRSLPTSPDAPGYRAPHVGAFADGDWQRLLAAFRVGGDARDRTLRHFGEERFLENLVWALGGSPSAGAGGVVFAPASAAPSANAPPSALGAGAGAGAVGGGGASGPGALSAGALQEDARDVFQVNLLVLLQENAEFILDSTQKVEMLYGHLLRAVARRTPGQLAPFVRAQALVALTHLLIQLDIVHSHESVTEDFVNVLLGLVLDTAESHDRYLRAAAAMCLEQLEECMVGLLVPALSLIMESCRAESTHSIHAMVCLFSTVLSHACLLEAAVQAGLSRDLLLGAFGSDVDDLASGTDGDGGDSEAENAHGSFGRYDYGSVLDSDYLRPDPPAALRPALAKGPGARNVGADAPPSFLSLAPIQLPYKLPSYVAHVPGAAVSALVLGGHGVLAIDASDAFLMDVRRCIALVFDHLHLLWDWGIEQCLLNLRFMRLFALPLDMVRHYVLSLIYSMSLISHQCVIDLLLYFRECLAPDDAAAVAQHLVLLMNEPQLSPDARVLISHWIAALARGGSGDSGPAGVRRVVAARARLLAPTVFDSLPLAEAKLRLMVRVLPEAARPVPYLMRLLPSVHHGLFGADHPRVIVYLAECEDMLATIGLPAVEPVYRALVGLLALRGGFVVRVTEFLDRVLRPPPGGAAPTRPAAALLREFGRAALAQPPAQLLPQLPVVLKVLSLREIAPQPYVMRLLQFVQLPGVCSEGNYAVGSTVLGICRAAMTAHATRELHPALADLLLHLQRHFADVAVRDRAALYYQLFTHLEGAELARVFAPIDDVSKATRNVIEVSAASKVLHPKVARQYSRFLTVERADAELLRASGVAVGGVAVPAAVLVAATRAPTADGGTPDSFVDRATMLVEAALARYKDAISSPRFSAPIEVAFVLRYGSDDVAAAPARIFGVMVRFRRSALFGPAAALHAAVLERPPGGSPSGALQHSALFLVTLRPLAPAPSELEVVADFCDADGGVGTCDAGVLQLRLRDFMFPFWRVDEAIAEAHGADAALGAALLEPLFDAMLAHLLRLAVATEPTAASRACAVSAKRIPHPRARVTAHFASAAWAQFCVRPVAALKDGEPLKLYIFLAPRHHLLCTVAIGVEHSDIDIATDHWYLLSLVDALFDVPDAE
jgi:hypothetical protein